MEQFSAMVTGTHDWQLVVLSVVIAIVTSYAALDFAGRATVARGRSRWAWLVGGSAGMGIGINAMHFVGMSGFHLPVPTLYHLPSVFVALLAAIFAPAMGLIVVTRREMSLPQSLAGSVCLGLGMVAMHYTGVASMRVRAVIHYDVLIVILSVLIALGGAFVALRLAFHCRDRMYVPGWRKSGSAALMGLAIASMHYTGMAAISFTLTDVPVNQDATVEISLLRAWSVGLVTLSILGFLTLVDVIDRRSLVAQTERRQTEKSLAESEERYRSLVEGAKDVVFSLARDGTITSINPSFEIMTGWSPIEWLGKPFMPLVHSDDRPFVLAMFHEALLGEEPETFEARIARKAGEYHICEFTTTPQIHRGVVVGVLGIGRDVTERKRAEAAVRKSDRLFQEVMEHSPALIFIKDSEGRYLQVNRKFEVIVRMTRHEILGKRDADIFPAHLAAVFQVNDQQVLRGGAPIEFEEVACYDEGLRTSIVSKFPVRDHEGTIYGLCAIITDITERKHAESSRKMGETRIRAVLKTALDAIVGMDEYGQITDWNPRAETIFGWTTDEAVGRSLADTIIPARFREAHAHGLQRFLAEGTGPVLNRRIEVIALRRDGTEFPAELSIGAMQIGDAWVFNAFVADITERKWAEEQLRTRERQLRALVISLDDIVFELDKHGTYLNVWAGNEHLLARPKEELLGRRIEELFGAEKAQPFLDAIAQAIGSGRSRETEFFLDLAEGRRWFLARTNPIIALGDSCTSVSMLVRDTTERKQAEFALRESEERLRLSLEAANQGIFDLNVKTGEAQVSPGYAGMLGYDPATFRETTAAWLERLHPQDRQRVETELSNYLTGRIPDYRVEFRQRTQKGDWRWILSHGRVLERGADDEPIRMLGTHTDITELKQTEEALRASEEQLRQAQKMEAVGCLAGGVAHDFNNLLTVIRGHSDLLADSVTMADGERQSVEQISEAAQRAIALTSQLLAFSRKQLLQPEVLNLSDVVKGMDKMLRPLIGEDITLTEGPMTCGTIYADKGQVEQVIMNLAVNARDAMPQGGHLTIATTDIDIDATFSDQRIAVTPGPHVLLTVSDTGTGIDLATQTRIFEPFFTTKPNGQGTGLGLSTVYGIVKQSGGAISVYSEVGKGTTFKIYFPRADRAVMRAERQDDTVLIISGAEVILLAEDEELVRTLTGRVLRAKGYTVHLAGSGEEAFKIAQEGAGPINLLVTDVVMPGMSGRELSERLAVSHPGVKVLYMSGYTDDAMIRNGILKEGMAFIQKPYTLMRLLRKVREVLDGAPAANNA